MTLDKTLKPIERVLIAGPPAGDLGTVEAGIELARRLEARVRVLQVQSSHPLIDRLGLDRLGIDRLGFDRHALEGEGAPNEFTDADIVRLAHRAGLRPSTLETETLRGQPRRLLLDEAARWGADLVILGRGEGGGSGVRPGTVAEHLIRQLACPVLVVDGGSPVVPARVLFPVDLSDFSRAAMACGRDFLRQLGAGDGVEERALFVVPAGGKLTDQQRRSIDRAGRRELADWLAEGNPPDLVDSAIEVGEPAAAIVERARDGADLIVMGTHGHGSMGFARRGVGSVTGQVLAAAPCSMLVVPPAVELGAEIAEAVARETAPRFDKRLFP